MAEPRITDDKMNTGSIFSDTPIKEENPANDSNTGPATQWMKQRVATSIAFRSPIRR
jgi:hypothetical protein